MRHEKKEEDIEQKGQNVSTEPLKTPTGSVVKEEPDAYDDETIRLMLRSVNG